LDRSLTHTSGTTVDENGLSTGQKPVWTAHIQTGLTWPFER
jgi:hypothetical protein